MVLSFPRYSLVTHFKPMYCPKSKLNVEHVIPKSLLKGSHIANDPRNLIALPSHLNSARSNYRYAELNPKDDLLRYAGGCASCNKSCRFAGKLAISHTKFDTIVEPPPTARGMIARSALMMAQKYPALQPLIHYRVLNTFTAVKWNLLYPPTDLEQDWYDALSIH